MFLGRILDTKNTFHPGNSQLLYVCYSEICLTFLRRILDTKNALLYILVLTNQRGCPLVTCTAAEVTSPQALGLDTDTYTLVSRAARLSFSTNTEFVSRSMKEKKSKTNMAASVQENKSIKTHGR